jgi:hypothetical protein
MRAVILGLWVVLMGCVVVGRLQVSDKVLHFGAYLGLAMLPVMGAGGWRRGCRCSCWGCCWKRGSTGRRGGPEHPSAKTSVIMGLVRFKQRAARVHPGLHSGRARTLDLSQHNAPSTTAP